MWLFSLRDKIELRFEWVGAGAGAGRHAIAPKAKKSSASRLLIHVLACEGHLCYAVISQQNGVPSKMPVTHVGVVSVACLRLNRLRYSL